MGPDLRSLRRESDLRTLHKTKKHLYFAKTTIEYTYEAVKAALLSKCPKMARLNSTPTRRCHSRMEKRGLYLHHKQYEYPANLENLDYIRTIKVCEDENLQTVMI